MSPAHHFVVDSEEHMIFLLPSLESFDQINYLSVRYYSKAPHKAKAKQKTQKYDACTKCSYPEQHMHTELTIYRLRRK